MAPPTHCLSVSLVRILLSNDYRSGINFNRERAICEAIGKVIRFILTLCTFTAGIITDRAKLIVARVCELRRIEFANDKNHVYDADNSSRYIYIAHTSSV